MNRFGVELRAAEVTGDTLAVRAHVFGQMAEIRGGWEAFHPGAFDVSLGRGDDVVALHNHDPAFLLGRRSSGTLRVEADVDDLSFEVDLPDTAYARDVRELVARGDLAGASFGFLPGDDELGRAPDGRQLRTHTSVKRLIDVSVVAIPAYDGTAVTLRSVDFGPAVRHRNLIVAARAALALRGSR